MKVIQSFKSVLLFICSVACVNKNDPAAANETRVKDTPAKKVAVVEDTFATGKVITSVVCQADAAQSYALYIPAAGKREALPIVYLFDPHGDGAYPVNKYKALADQYNFILAGSNNSKNGNDFATAEKIWTVLFADTKKRLKINVARVYTCGFSGGAKVAGYIALNNPEVQAVITGGAGLPETTKPGNFHFSITAIAGEGDMNMTDLVAMNAALDKTQTRHRIIFFAGKHEWAPPATMSIAFAGLQLEAMYQKLIPINNSFISNYIIDSKKRVADLLKTNNYTEAEAECQLSIAMLQGLTRDINWLTQQSASIKSNTAYKKQSQARQQLLVTEQNLKELYNRQFQQGDMNYWTATIQDLHAKAKALTPEGAMYQRLVAYLSLAFYSISNQLIATQRDKEAQYFTALYILDDATNPEAWYLSAIAHARNKNAAAAKNDLLSAVDNGFTDKNRLEHQPEFQNLSIDFSAIERKMKK